MPRKVFFSFHHKRDIWRVGIIRNCGVFRGDDAQPFLDAAAWEEVRKLGTENIKRWIDKEMEGKSVLVVCIGNETNNRRWVRYEIGKAHDEQRGIIGIRIHNMKNQDSETDNPGRNPLDTFYITQNGEKICFSELYPTYDWVGDEGRKNIEDWVERSAIKAGR